MSYLYGDSTSSTLEVNFIEFLRDAVEFCVQVLLADQSIVAGQARTRSLDHVTADEIERLEKVGELVSKAFEEVPWGDEDSAAARCVAAIVRSAGELVRTETAEVLAALDAEITKRDAQAARERDGCVKALGALLVKHDLPDMTLDLHLALVSGAARYGCRARITTGFGLDAVLDLDIPADHLFERVVRVDRLAERLDVHAPEMAGWLHKEVKLRAQHLEKHYVTALSIKANGGTLKLRTAADGTGPGYDIVFATEAPRVRLARVDEREGPPEAPFEVEEADAAKLLALQEKLAAAAIELARHRKGIVDATLDGELLRTHAKPALLVERLIAIMAPTAQEIASRSQSPGELVLRRLLGDGRREEIFLSKNELKRKLEPLLESNRALFGPLWLEGSGGVAPAPSVNTRKYPASVQADRPTAPSVSSPAAPVQAVGPAAALPETESTGAPPIRHTPVSPAPSAPVQKSAQPASPPATPSAEPARRDPPRPRPATPALGTPPPMPATPESAAKPAPAAESTTAAPPIRQRPATPALGTPPPVPVTPESPAKPALAVESKGALPLRPKPGTPALGTPPQVPAMAAGPAASPPATESPRGEAPRRPSGPQAVISSTQSGRPPSDRAPAPAAAEPRRKDVSGSIETAPTKEADPATRS